MVETDNVTREEFENLTGLVLKMKDTLAKCNLKVSANFDDLELEESDDYDDDYREEDLEDDSTGFTE